MTQETKLSILEFVDAILTFDAWHNYGSILMFPKGVDNKGYELRDYFDDHNLLWEMDKDNNLKLLKETLMSYDSALEDDWLPKTIEGLPIPKAYLFLKEIKNILEQDIPDNKIEQELIDRYHKVEDTTL